MSVIEELITIARKFEVETAHRLRGIVVDSDCFDTLVGEALDKGYCVPTGEMSVTMKPFRRARVMGFTVQEEP